MVARAIGMHLFARRSAGALAVAGLAMLVVLLSATPAQAVVARARGHAYGITPVRGVNAQNLPAVKRALPAPGASTTGPLTFDKTSQLSYHGGPVMHSVTTHVIYWDPNGEFTTTTKGVIHSFFADVAHDSGLGTNVWGVAGQYGDGSGHAIYSSTFGTEETDEAAYPESICSAPLGGDLGPPYTHCLTDEQLQSELASYVSAHSLPKGPAQQYFVLLPHKVTTCLEEEFEGEQACSNNFFCAYHSVINEGTSNELIYSDIPFSLLDSEFAKGCQADENIPIQLPNGDTTGTNATTRFADVALKYISHEYIEAATDPTGKGWWETAHGQEIADKCNVTGSESKPGEDPNAFLPTLGGSASIGTLFNQTINGGDFYLQSEWDNTLKACLMRPATLSEAKFTFSPASGTVGSPIKFTGSATDPYGSSGLAFTWKFGDGVESTGAAPQHVFAAPGSYEVTMTPRDAFTGSTAAPVVHTVVVVSNASTVVTESGSSATTATSTPTPTFTPTPSVVLAAPVPNSAFGPLTAALSSKTGAITFTGRVADPGSFGWLLNFPNGKFGVFTSATGKCKQGFVRLKRKCRPAEILFGKGSKLVAPGVVRFTVRPSKSALKALRRALARRKGIPVTATFTFQSSRGGGPFSRTQSWTVKLKRK